MTLARRLQKLGDVGGLTDDDEAMPGLGLVFLTGFWPGPRDEARWRKAARREEERSRCGIVFPP